MFSSHAAERQTHNDDVENIVQRHLPARPQDGDVVQNDKTAQKKQFITSL